MKKILILLLTLFLWSSVGYSADTQVPTTDLPSKQEKPIYVNTPTTFLDDDASVWESAGNTLINTTSGDISLFVSGYGGDAMVGVRFVQSLAQAEANGVKVHMVVVGPAYSMHAFLTCAGSDVTIRPGGTLMFHQMYGVISMALNLVGIKLTANDVAFSSTQDYMLNLCISKGILTAQDKQNILNGYEVYITNVNNQLVKITKPGESLLLISAIRVSLFIINLSIILGIIYLVVYTVRRALK